MERPRNATGDENRPGDDRVLGHSVQVQNRDAAQDKPHRDDPVDVGKQPEVPEQPRAANDNQSNGQTGISHESSPPNTRPRDRRVANWADKKIPEFIAISQRRLLMMR